MAMKGFSTLSKFPELEPHYRVQFSFIFLIPFVHRVDSTLQQEIQCTYSKPFRKVSVLVGSYWRVTLLLVGQASVPLPSRHANDVRLHMMRRQKMRCALKRFYFKSTTSKPFILLCFWFVCLLVWVCVFCFVFVLIVFFFFFFLSLNTS